jgi:hypothetical protein
MIGHVRHWHKADDIRLLSGNVRFGVRADILRSENLIRVISIPADKIPCSRSKIPCFTKIIPCSDE